MFPGAGLHADVDGRGHQHDEANRRQKAPPHGGGIILHPRIGGKGDLIERRHELGHHQLGEEQRFGIKADVMRLESPPGDEDVAL